MLWLVFNTIAAFFFFFIFLLFKYFLLFTPHKVSFSFHSARRCRTIQTQTLVRFCNTPSRHHTSSLLWHSHTRTHTTCLQAVVVPLFSLWREHGISECKASIMHSEHLTLWGGRLPPVGWGLYIFTSSTSPASWSHSNKNYNSCTRSCCRVDNELVIPHPVSIPRPRTQRLQWCAEVRLSSTVLMKPEEMRWKGRHDSVDMTVGFCMQMASQGSNTFFFALFITKV